MPCSPSDTSELFKPVTKCECSSPGSWKYSFLALNRAGKGGTMAYVKMTHDFLFGGLLYASTNYTVADVDVKILQ